MRHVACGDFDNISASSCMLRQIGVVLRRPWRAGRVGERAGDWPAAAKGRAVEPVGGVARASTPSFDIAPYNEHYNDSMPRPPAHPTSYCWPSASSVMCIKAGIVAALLVRVQNLRKYSLSETCVIKRRVNNELCANGRRRNAHVAYTARENVRHLPRSVTAFALS